MKVYRQGDVAFVPREDVSPALLQAKGTVKPSRIVKRGENGGVHMLEKPATVAKEDMPDSTLVEYEGKVYVLSASGVKVLHREHKTVDLPAGVYEVRQQREVRDEQIRR